MLEVNFKSKTDFEIILFLKKYVKELKNKIQVIEDENNDLKKDFNDIKSALSLTNNHKDAKIVSQKILIRNLRDKLKNK